MKKMKGDERKWWKKKIMEMRDGEEEKMKEKWDMKKVKDWRIGMRKNHEGKLKLKRKVREYEWKWIMRRKDEK